MPRYDYHCKVCAQDFVIEASITDKRDNVVCGHCQGQDVFRIFAGVGLTQMPTRGSNSLSKPAGSSPTSEGADTLASDSKTESPTKEPSDNKAESSASGSKETVSSDAKV